jgi:putative thioredoxin
MSSLLGLTPDATSPSPANGADPVKDTNEAQFAQDVLEASQEVPVIVDFTAPWCGPCKTLIPLLEKHVRGAKGAVKMVKVNIDENQMLASQLRIQSVPTVYAFYQGRPVDGFQGAVPESQVKEFVGKLAKLGGGGVDEEAVQQALQAGQAALEAKDGVAALEAFQAVLGHDETNKAAYAGLASAVALLEGPEAARELIASLEADYATSPEMTSALAAIKLAEESAGLIAELQPLEQRLAADPSDHQAAIDLASALAGMGEKERAIDTLIASIRRDRDWNEGAAKAKLLELFEAFGGGDPATKSGRRKLSSLLFS